MDKQEKVVKHLEMTQGVINRLGSNSFLLKGGSLTILAAALVLVARAELSTPYFILAFIAPVVILWGLDGYFLWQERLFRQIYDEVRKMTNTDFNMRLQGKPESGWLGATFSRTLAPFYIMEMVIVAVVFAIAEFGLERMPAGQPGC